MTDTHAKTILDFLPSPGEHMQVPGGYVYCDFVEVSRGSHEVTGLVSFQFEVTPEEYDKALAGKAAKRIECGEVPR
jgi:hypothetical protein